MLTLKEIRMVREIVITLEKGDILSPEQGLVLEILLRG
jgi:hypothetical protein